MQLRPLFWAALACTLAPTGAFADGEVSVRGFYYKEQSTKVQQPAIDGRFDVGDDGEITGHVLLDAITSASVASGAAGEAFTEYRWEGGLGYQHTFGIWRVGATGRYSREPDYTSVFVGARGQAELADKNTTVGLGINYGSDSLSNAGAQGGIMAPIEGDLRTILGSVSVSQLVSPTVVVGATYDLMYLDGFLESPYRTVVAGGFAEMERVPDTRWRHAVFASARSYLPSTSTTLFAGYRLYLDDWGVSAHTPEVRVIQELPRGIEAAGRFRYHRQTRADFYKSVYDSNDPTIEPFLTDDPKLSAFDGQTLGLKLEGPLSALGATGIRGGVRLSGVVEYVRQDNRFGNAVVAIFGFTVPFEY